MKTPNTPISILQANLNATVSTLVDNGIDRIDLTDQYADVSIVGSTVANLSTSFIFTDDAHIMPIDRFGRFLAIAAYYMAKIRGEFTLTDIYSSMTFDGESEDIITDYYVGISSLGLIGVVATLPNPADGSDTTIEQWLNMAVISVIIYAYHHDLDITSIDVSPIAAELCYHS